MKHSSGPRKTANLSESVHQQLNAYAIAAGAAGVGMLALAQPSEAKVVYTPVHHVILRQSSFGLDLNHDGKVDFEINQTSGCTTGGNAGFGGFCQTRLYAYVPYYQDRGNAVMGQAQWPFHAIALKAGAPISTAQPFGASALYFRSRASNTAGRCTGSWTNVKNRYLGLKFKIKGKVHFGWARLSVTCALHSKSSGVLTGYAYETVPNRPIRAGQTSRGEDPVSYPGSADGSGFISSLTNPTPDIPNPASLGMIALGAQGVPLWRRKETQEVIGQ
jgi:hypothetical protein